MFEELANTQLPRLQRPRNSRSEAHQPDWRAQQLRQDYFCWRAICLLVSHKNPQVAISSQVVRGPTPADEQVTTPLSVETTWKHLFHGIDTTRPIKIDGAR